MATTVKALSAPENATVIVAAATAVVRKAGVPCFFRYGLDDESKWMF